MLLVGALYGLILGPVLTLHSIKAITAGFGSGTILFAVLFAFGRSTKHDLSSWVTQLNAALIALIIVSFLAAILHLVKIPRKPRHFSNGIQAKRHLDSLSIK